MKLNKKGWGYRYFVLLMCLISGCVLVAHHYIVLLIGK